MPGRPAPLRVLIGLALPMVLARATQSVITFADVLQVKHLGPGALAATSTGGLNVFGLELMPMATTFIIQSFVSQHTGRGEREATVRFAWYGLAIALAAATITAALIPLVGPVLSHTSYSPAVREQMTDYMSIRMLSVGAAVGVEALGNWYGGLGNTKMQMIAGILTMVAAVFLNWVLIGGHLGAPAMGVAGAALASTLASWLGFAYIAIAFWRRWGGAPKTKKALGASWRELRRVVRFGLPNGLNWFLEFTAFQLFVNVVLASLGDNTVAALNIVIAINALSFMPAFGLASAGAILAGQAIGRDDRDAVWPQVKITLACTIGWMGAIAVVYLVVPDRVIGLFAEGADPRAASEMVAIGTTMLMMSAFWQVFDATAMTLSETLRAAGDTTWTAIVRVGIAWLVFAPGAWLVVHVGHGGAVGAMICFAGYLALLASAIAWRFRSGKWRSIDLIEPRLE